MRYTEFRFAGLTIFWTVQASRQDLCCTLTCLICGSLIIKFQLFSIETTLFCTLTGCRLHLCLIGWFLGTLVGAPTFCKCSKSNQRPLSYFWYAPSSGHGPGACISSVGNGFGCGGACIVSSYPPQLVVSGKAAWCSALYAITLCYLPILKHSMIPRGLRILVTLKTPGNTKYRTDSGCQLQGSYLSRSLFFGVSEVQGWTDSKES